MIASLNPRSAATSRSVANREFSVSVLFQLTMKPSIPADMAWSTCWRMTLAWSLEYRPTAGKSFLARFHEVAVYQM